MPRGADRFGHDVGAVEIGTQHQRDLCFRLWLKCACGVEATAVRYRHVREQRAVVGLIDTELRLDRLGRQPDLTAN